MMTTTLIHIFQEKKIYYRFFAQTSLFSGNKGNNPGSKLANIVSLATLCEVIVES